MNIYTDWVNTYGQQNENEKLLWNQMCRCVQINLDLFKSVLDVQKV